MLAATARSLRGGGGGRRIKHGKVRVADEYGSGDHVGI